MGVADNKSYKDMRHFNTGFYGNLTLQDVPSIKGDPEINSTIKENPYLSNVEIEGGEMVLDPEMKALFKATGKKHSNGGMDVNLKPDSFIFSDDKSLSFDKKDHELFELKMGGSKQVNNTPAEVLKRNVDAKHYNTMVSILDDPKSTDLAKNTASKMLEKYIGTLGNVAFIQEQKKGLPTGVPSFSQNTAPVYDPTIKDEIMSQKQYLKYGGNIMAWAGGNPIKNKRTSVWPNPQQGYSPRWEHDINMKPDQLIMPADLGNNTYQSVLSPQHKNKDGSYGNNINIPDFMRRQNWYVKDHPGFNPLNPKQLHEFEGTYNTEAQRRGYTPYYLDDGFRGADSMFGMHHNYTPGFQDPPDQPDPTTPAPPPTPYTPTKFGPPPAYNVPPVVPNTPYGANDTGKEIKWQMTPYQKLSQLYSGSQWAGVKRYMPMRSQMNPSYTDAQLVNPEQTIGDMRGQMNNQTSALTSLSPIMAQAQQADAYGQFLDKIPGVRSQYDNQNAQIVNQNRQYNNQVRNNATSQNMQNDAKYYEQSITGQTNFDNMKNFKSDQWMNNVMGDVQTNQALAYQLASMKNPAYGFDFQTGNFIRNPKNILDVQNDPKNDLYTSIAQSIAKKIQAGQEPGKQETEFFKALGLSKLNFSQKMGGRLTKFRGK